MHKRLPLSKRIALTVLMIQWVLLGLPFSGGTLLARGMPSEGIRAERKLITLFWREGCGHCSREKEFLKALQRSMPYLEVQGFNIDQPPDRSLFDDFTNRYNLPKVTPITIVGRKYIVGFDAPETTGAEIQRLLGEEQDGTTLDSLFEATEAQGEGEVCPVTGPSTPFEPSPDGLRYLSVPIWGRIDLARFTLPTLSLVLGLIDGFNPCAMWVLVAFLTALAQVGSAIKMIQFASVFMLAEAIMYFAILNSWFAAFDFIRADKVVTPVVGIVAILGGIFFLWEYRHSDGSCKGTSFEKRTRTISLINRLSSRNLTPMVVLGILGLAFSVNVVEFACSIGIPQAYAKILDINRVGLLKREGLMGLYTLAYMLDDLLVFGLAIWSIEKIGLTTRYSRMCNLAGGVIMLILGLALIWAPEKLRF